MNHRMILAALAMVAIGMTACVAAPKKTFKTTGSIERLDPALDNLIAKDAQIEVLAGGFIWTEGPVWIKDGGGFVIFSDIPNNRVMKWSEKDGLSLYLKPAGYTGKAKRGGETGSNGLQIGPKGRLILCQHGDRRMAYMDAPLTQPASKFVTIADKHNGKRFNSPNDSVFHKNGDLYFTDPPYGLAKNVNDPAKEIPYQGIYRVDTKGKVTLLSKELERPNGITFSPDYKTLYAANSHGPNPVWLAWPVKADGTLGKSRVFFDARKAPKGPGRKGSQDGMKVDVHGNVFATGPGGVLIFTPEGKHIGTILTGERTANCAFGDDGMTLYMTADDFLMRVRLKTKGFGF
jgi:gluconolactonase